jgi:hypothetical protein
LQTEIPLGIGRIGWRSVASLSGDRTLSRSGCVVCSGACRIRRAWFGTSGQGCMPLCPCFAGLHETNPHHSLGLPEAIAPMEGCRAGRIADLACGHEEADRAAILIRDSMQFGPSRRLCQSSAGQRVMPPLVWPPSRDISCGNTLPGSDQTTAPPFFNPRLEAVRCALALSWFASKPLPGSGQVASIIHAWSAMALRKERSQPRHFVFAQPIKIAHSAPKVREHESCSASGLKKINGSGA